MLQLAILLPLLAALAIPYLHKRIKLVHTGWFVLIVPILLFFYLLSYAPEIWEGPLLLTQQWIPSLDINFNVYVDGLSLLFGLLITGIGSLVVLYSIFYLDKEEKLGHFYVYLLMFMTAMLGVVLSDNLFVLYSFWELTSLSSFLLIGYWNFRERSRYGAQKSLIITVLGGLSMLGGFIWMSVTADTTSIRGLIANKDLILDSPYFAAMLILVLLGAFTKSAQFPFHIWLPDAMEAPTPVSAYLHSATMVKAGLYLVARLSLLFSGTDMFFLLVTGIGMLTLFWGSYMAVKQTDLKAILAFSTVSQLGMIMSLFGIGTGTAILAAIFHIFNHATFKGSLFMVAGIVDHETGTRDIRRLGGLMTFMPLTATLALFGTFSMAGVPLPIFNGFLSKEMFFDATVKAAEGGSAIVDAVAPYLPYVAVTASIFTFIYSMVLFFVTFRGQAKLEQLEKKPHDPPIGMLVPPTILVILIVVIGLFPNLINEALLAPAVAAVNGVIPHAHIQFWHGFRNIPLYMSIAVIAFGTILYLTRNRWEQIYSLLPGKLSANKVYDKSVDYLFIGSEKITNFYMRGSLHHYMSIILFFVASFLAMTMWRTGGFTISFEDLAPLSWPEILIAIVMVIAALGTAITSNRIAAILILGVVGYGLSLLFVFFRAPDLALTQLIVETVSVALYLLVFYHLPKLEKPDDTRKKQGWNITIAASVGIIMTMIGIASHSSKQFETIAEYFIETSYTLGGGKNIVNVILVDMRGLDTMLEITVLGLAALGIYSMIKLRKKGESK